MTPDQLRLHLAAVKRRRRAARRAAEVLAGGWGRFAQVAARCAWLYPVITPLTGRPSQVSGKGSASANWRRVAA